MPHPWRVLHSRPLRQACPALCSAGGSFPPKPLPAPARDGEGRNAPFADTRDLQGLQVHLWKRHGPNRSSSFLDAINEKYLMSHVDTGHKL